MATRDEDRALAARVVRGEASAAEVLFDQVFDPLYRHACVRLNGDHHAAQDVVSETLLSGLRALRDYRADAALTTWFLRIASRKVIDLKRRRAVRLVSSGDGGLEAVLCTHRSQTKSPLEHLADEETRLVIQEALQSLPSHHREILRWKYFEDTSLRQVALRLNVTTKGVERRLARARSALAGALRQRGVAQ